MGLFLWSCRTEVHKNTLSECASLVPAQLEPLGKLRPEDSSSPLQLQYLSGASCQNEPRCYNRL